MIHNYSDRPLTTEETDALARGLQFAFQPVKLNYCRYFLPFEKLFKDVKNEPIYNNSQDAKNRIRASIKGTAFKCFYNHKSVQDEETKKMIATLKALSTDPSIDILKPDKGNGVVILNKADYESKMNSIIQDCTKFTFINDNDWFKQFLKHEDLVNRYLYNSFFLQFFLSFKISSKFHSFFNWHMRLQNRQVSSTYLRTYHFQPIYCRGFHYLCYRNF